MVWSKIYYYSKCNGINRYNLNYPIIMVINVVIQVKVIYTNFLITTSFSGVVLPVCLNKKKGRFHGE